MVLIFLNHILIGRQEEKPGKTLYKYRLNVSTAIPPIIQLVGNCFSVRGCAGRMHPALAIYHVDLNYVIEAGRMEGALVDSVPLNGILTNEPGKTI